MPKILLVSSSTSILGDLRLLWEVSGWIDVGFILKCKIPNSVIKNNETVDLVGVEIQPSQK